jgi:hypothetical protein
MKYVLLKKVQKEQQKTESIYSVMGFGPMVVPGEEWKSEDGKKEEIVFVALVEKPAQVLKLVRKNPTDKYLLFYGEVEELTVAMPVFMGGKNLAQLNSEWNQAE